MSESFTFKYILEYSYKSQILSLHLLNILFIFLTLATTLAYSEVVDKIVVVVNDEIITQGELDRMLLPVYKQYKGLYAGAELEEKLEEVRA